MQKSKSSMIKTVIVECRLKESVDKYEFKIDSDIFDDIHMEASTRFVENYIKNNNTKIAPFLSTYEKKDSKNVNKHMCYNTYYVMINAGFHSKAEIMRKNFKIISNIDLKTVKIKDDKNAGSTEN